MGSRAVSRWIEGGLLFVGLVLVGVWLRAAGESHAFQAAASQQLDVGASRDSLTETPAPEGAGVLRGSGPAGALGRIEIPRLRISAMIAEGTEAEVLARAVGHVTSTARPGSPGNVALAGHRDTFFRGLGGVRENDLIRIVTLDATYTYQVEWAEVVGARRLDLLDSTATPSLTLVTCYPFRWVGPAPKRFVVRAVSADAPAPGD